ncbi:hypothetical protein [Polaromonas sp. SM01]|uniref:hypothetical protein n=1 Tax=Polaromonas sp. SM01 TaxID=3085630 RepID=UPI0029825422|nr:hypothetical protein [Polaromonas sp. SM01]MDW5443638.1 hypothetical protein [Polaromonas sp. SM01]
MNLAAVCDPVADFYASHHGWLRKEMGGAYNAADLAQGTFSRILSRPLDWREVREPRAYLSARPC